MLKTINKSIGLNKLIEDSLDSKIQKIDKVTTLKMRHLALIISILGANASFSGCSKEQNLAKKQVEQEVESKETSVVPEIIEEFPSEKKFEYKVLCGDGFCDAKAGERTLCPSVKDDQEGLQQLISESACAMYKEDHNDFVCSKDCIGFFDNTKDKFCGDEVCDGNENHFNCSDCKN